MELLPYPPYNKIHDAETQLESWARICLGLHETLEIISGTWIICNEIQKRIIIYDRESDWLLSEEYDYIRSMNPWR